MKTNIKFGIGALLAAMLLLSMAFVSVVSAEVLIEDTVTEIMTTDQPELVPEPLPDIAVDTTSVAEQNPYWYLLLADKEQQKTLFEYIDNSYVSKKEKQEMKKSNEGHARCCRGWKDTGGNYLYINDPWPMLIGDIYWEDWDDILHTNYIYVK